MVPGGSKLPDLAKGMTSIWNDECDGLYERTYRVLCDARINEKLADALAIERTLATVLAHANKRLAENKARQIRTMMLGHLIGHGLPTREKAPVCPANFSLDGGEGGIRTPDTLASMPHFECGAFNHSATSPEPKTGL